MDYQSLPRKQLQALCKKHSIPANSTNVSMADALAALFNAAEHTKGSGHQGFQKQEVSSDDRSGSVLTDIFNTPSTNTRGKRHGPEAQDENAGKLGSSSLKPNVVRSAGTASRRRRRGEAMIESEAIGDSKVKTRTRGRIKNIVSEAMINKEESLHSSEVDVEENSQVSDEKEDIVETDDEPVKGLEGPRHLQNERQPRKKFGQAEDEKAVAEGIRVDDDASKAEVTPALRRSARVKSAEVVDVCPVGTRSSSKKKVGNADSVKKMPETSSIMSTATKIRRTKMPAMTIEVSDNENEDSPVEKAGKVSRKKKSMAKTPVCSQRTSRSCPQDSEEGILEESVGKAQEASTRQAQKPVATRPQVVGFKKQEPSSEVRQNAASSRKTMKIATEENRKNVANQILAADIKVEKVEKVKEVGDEMRVDTECREKIASEEENGGVKNLIQALSSCKQGYRGPAAHLFEESACKVKQICPQREQNPVPNIHEAVDSKKQGQQSSELTGQQQGKVPSRCTEECQVVATDLKPEPVKRVDEDELSGYREAVKHFKPVEIGGRILVRESQLCEDSNEKRLHDISEAAGTEQVENKSMVKVADKKNHRSCARSLLTETCHLGEMDGQNVFQVEGGIKCHVQDVCLHEEEPYNAMWPVCPYIAATHVSRPIEGESCSLLTMVNSGMVEVESCSLDHQTVCMAEEGSCCEEMARDTCASNADTIDTGMSKIEGPDLETGDNDGIGNPGRIHESGFWDQQTVYMAGERTHAREMERDMCASSVDAKDTGTSKIEGPGLESSTLNVDKSQETEDEDGDGNSGGIQESSFCNQQTACTAGERTPSREMEKDTCASNGEVQGSRAHILTSGKSQETEGENGVGISGGSRIQEKAEPMHVEFNAEADLALPNAINSRNVNEVKGILVPHDKSSTDLKMQQLDACRQFSFLAGNATANHVSGSTEFLHIDMIQNVSEAQDEVVTELGNVAGQHMNILEEEYPGIETVPSNDFNFLGDQHMPRNPADEINDNAVEARLQVIYNSSLLIDGVSETILGDLDNTEEEDDQGVQKSKDCVHGSQSTSKILQQRVSDLTTVENKEHNPIKQFDGIEGNLYTVTVSLNDLKEQTHLQQDSMSLLGEKNASTVKFGVETNADGKNSIMAKCEMDNTEVSLAHPWKSLCLRKSELAIMSHISPCLNAPDEEKCSDIKCTSFDEKFQQLLGNEGGLAKDSLSDHTSMSLIEKQGSEFHGENDIRDFSFTEGYDEYIKWPGNLQKVSVEIPDQVRGQEESAIMDDGLQIANLEEAGCKLQVQTQEKICSSAANELLDLDAPVSINDQRLGIPNSSFRGSEHSLVKELPLDLNDFSLRKLRALCKEKKVQLKEAVKGR